MTVCTAWFSLRQSVPPLLLVNVAGVEAELLQASHHKVQEVDVGEVHVAVLKNLPFKLLNCNRQV